MKFIGYCLYISLVAAELHEQLHYFETLKVVDVKVRKKRSLDSQTSFTKDVTFSAFGRNFNLFLTPGSPVISADLAIKLVYGDGRTSPLYIDHNAFYTGHSADDETVKVDAYQEDGAWGINIYEKNEIYTLEPSWRHLPPSDNHSMIVYRHSDIKWNNLFPELNKTHDSIKVCGAVHPEDDPDLKPVQHMADEHLHNERDSETEHSRTKRSLWTLNTCHIIAVADYTFFNGPGGGFPHQTANYLVQTIQKVNSIFKKTVWNEERQLTGLHIQIKEMRIHTESTEPKQFHSNNKHYNMDQSHWPDSALLKQFGLDQDLTNFCLAHLFTHRKFDGGVLGLAYIASPRKFSTGGICSQLGSSKVAYNTGFSSTMNTKGNNMLTQEAVLVTAHGHNWGSEHDAETSECAPSSFNKGKFLMFPYAVSGYEENNNEFSPCSKRYVTEVLLAKAGSCFKEKELEESRFKENVPMCGNGKIDKDEQCDSGGLGISGLDPCCDNSCKLKPNATCSPVNWECCKNCIIAPRDMVCRGASKEQCKKEAKCSGYSFDCPASQNISDTPEVKCIDEGVCKKGRCLSYCERHLADSVPCRCTQPGNECLRCCQQKGHNCQSVNASDFLTDGRPCSFGYCEAGKCIQVRTNLIQRLFTFIEKLTPDTLVAFMKSNIVGTIIVFSLVIWIPLSWTVSCIDKRSEKKSRLLQAHWNTVLASHFDNYKIKEGGSRRTFPSAQFYPKARLPNIMEGGKHKPTAVRKYKFNHQPDGPEDFETVM
nr:ADAM 17-like protease isoform X2 [Biomphalaria glabrata]